MRALVFVVVLLASPALATPQRCAHIAAGVVDNVIIADPASGLAGVDCSNPAAQIGWTFAAGVYTPVAAPVVNPTTALSFIDFMGLFTAAEQIALITATDPQARVFLAMAEGAPQIDLTDPRVIRGVAYVAALGLIAPARVAVILAGTPAP